MTKEEVVEKFNDWVLIEEADCLNKHIQENGFSIFPQNNSFCIWGKYHSLSFPASKENCEKIIKVCSPDFNPRDIGERLDTSNIPNSVGAVQSFSEYISIDISVGKNMDMYIGIALKKSEVSYFIQDWLYCQAKIDFM